MESSTQQLAVNDGALTSKNSAFLRVSDLTLPMEELRARYEADGYLFLKHLLPREKVLDVRKKYFEFLSPTGVLKEGTEPVEGIFNTTNSPDDFPGIGSGTTVRGEKAEEFLSRAVEAHYEDWYTEFCKNSVLYDFVSKFTGWGQNTLALNRTLLRNNVPNSTPIGVHYDQIFLRYGEPTSVTAWLPIGDIKLNGGGLIYLQNGIRQRKHSNLKGWTDITF
jgi:phytanoyl-CoA hydroxylase